MGGVEPGVSPATAWCYRTLSTLEGTLFGAGRRFLRDALNVAGHDDPSKTVT